MSDETKKFVADVCRIMERHMGRWTTSIHSKVILPKPEKMDEWLLHFADLLSSRDFMDIKFDKDNLIGDEFPF